MDDFSPLVPRPKLWLRLTLATAMLALMLISTGPPSVKLIAAVSMIGVLGTYPAMRINPRCFEKHWRVAFIPIGTTREPLDQFVHVETDLEQRFGLGAGCALALLVGVWNVVMVRVLDWLLPWAGGDYKLWLRTGGNRRVLAWQGNGEANFRHNLEVLEAVSGLRVVRG
jgi:hypothetical protein